MDPNVIAIGLTVLSNVLFMGFIYGRMAARLDALTETLRSYTDRTDRAVDSHETQLRDHVQRISRLEVLRGLTPGNQA